MDNQEKKVTKNDKSIETIKSEIEELDPPLKADLVETLVSEEPKMAAKIVASHFSGPLPPPEVLQGYDNVISGGADRIISMAEEQGKHRRSMESKGLEYAYKIDSRGQNYALIISLIIIIGGMVLISLGHEISGALLSGSTLVGLAYVFISGRNPNEDNNDTES